MLDSTEDKFTPLHRSLVDTAFDALVIIRDGRLIYANPAFSELIGYAADEVIGLPALTFVAPESHDLVRYQMTTPDAPPRYEATGLRKDGRRIDLEVLARPVDFEGAPARVAAIRDVTEAHRAVRELRRSEQSFRELIEKLPDMVMVHRSGTILYANSAMVRYLAVEDAAEVAGTSLVALLHRDERAAHQDRIRQQEQTPRPEQATTVRHLRADGRLTTLETASVPIQFDGGLATLALARDVTQRARLEQRLVQSELLASIGVLAAAVNHEINNPLSFLVLTQASLETEVTRLGAKLASRDEQAIAASMGRLAQYAKELREGIDRVTTIARDFKMLTRVHGDLVQPVDIAAVIGSAARVAAAEIGGQCELELALVQVPPARAHAGRLGQVVLNLIVNAAQAMPPRGGLIRVATRVSGDKAFVDVDDNGPGISPEASSHLFEPFFTTKPEGKGSGLGLSICQGIVTSFGGSIEVLPSKLGGARFSIQLPLWTDETLPA